MFFEQKCSSTIFFAFSAEANRTISEVFLLQFSKMHSTSQRRKTMVSEKRSHFDYDLAGPG